PTQDVESGRGSPKDTIFDRYARSFAAGEERVFASRYPFDISVISDDNPFFYKYYKLASFDPLAVLALHNSGTVVFMTQALMLLQAALFIACFVLGPLFFLKR